MSLSRQMMTKPSTFTMFGKLWSSIIGEHFLSLYFSKTVLGTTNGLNAPSLTSNSRLEEIFMFSLLLKICQIFTLFQSPSKNLPDFHTCSVSMTKARFSHFFSPLLKICQIFYTSSISLPKFAIVITLPEIGSTCYWIRRNRFSTSSTKEIQEGATSRRCLTQPLTCSTSLTTDSSVSQRQFSSWTGTKGVLVSAISSLLDCFARIFKCRG